MVHDAGFADGGVYMRFKLPGLNKGEMLQAGFVDREVSATVHAGHLGYVFLAEASVALKDSKSYYLEIKKRRDAAQGEPSRDEMIAMGKATTVTVPSNVGHEWHELVLITEGDVMRASLDGKVVNEYKSEAFVLFNFMLDELKERVTGMLARVEIAREEPPPMVSPFLNACHPEPGTGYDTNEDGQYESSFADGVLTLGAPPLVASAVEHGNGSARVTGNDA
jgi:hypothetical protein